MQLPSVTQKRFNCNIQTEFFSVKIYEQTTHDCQSFRIQFCAGFILQLLEKCRLYTLWFREQTTLRQTLKYG